MAIQNRRGKFEDFNPDELLAGEFAVVQEGDTASTTGRSLYICFEPGVVKRIADYEDIGDEIAEAAGIYIDDLRTVVSNAESATTAAETATEDANTAAEAARQAAGGDISLKTVTFTEPSTPSPMESGDPLSILIGKIQANRSHVGMIIHSTTLDTMAKVINVYGGTTWIQHSGYFLYGATSGVVAGSTLSDGGESTHTLTIDEMPSHGHDVQPTIQINDQGGGQWRIGLSGFDGDTTRILHAANTGGGQAHNNMPPYKNVYIWERTA